MVVVMEMVVLEVAAVTMASMAVMVLEREEEGKEKAKEGGT
jgi:hypothetical protein